MMIQPKKKIDELAEILNKSSLSEVFNEFKYARCIRLLDQSESLISYDYGLMIRSLIELKANHIDAAHNLTIEAYTQTEDIRVLRNAIFVFNQTFGIHESCKVIKKLGGVIVKLNLDFKNKIPSDIDLPIFLNGELVKSEIDPIIYKIIGESPTRGVNYWRDVANELEISELQFQEIGKIINEILRERNIRCLELAFSYIDEDLLMLLHVDKDFKTIQMLNNQLFNRCFEKDLTDVLNKISYYFVPFGGATND